MIVMRPRSLSASQFYRCAGKTVVGDDQPKTFPPPGIGKSENCIPAVALAEKNARRAKTGAAGLKLGLELRTLGSGRHALDPLVARGRDRPSLT